MNKIAIYTAIIDQYDDLPEVEKVEKDIDYICFSDENLEAKYPWKVVKFKKIFADPVRDARRIKLLPHLFLPSYTASLWIDANVRVVNCPSSFIFECLDNHVIASMAHPIRNCTYDEADVILELKIDSVGHVKAQMEKYKNMGLPRGRGLHSSGVLFRKHMDIDCKKFSHMWWSELSNNSKRDQLSFDFVSWLLKEEINTFPYLLEEGDIFGWAKYEPAHKSTHNDRLKYTSYWSFPSLRLTRNAIYQEQEISTDFLSSVQCILSDAVHDPEEKLPLPISDSASERSALLKLSALAPKVLFLGEMSPLWALWMLAIHPKKNKGIFWPLGDNSSFYQEAESVLAKFPDGHLVRSLKLPIQELLKENAAPWFSTFGLVVISSEAVSQEVCTSVIKALSQGTQVMFLPKRSEWAQPLSIEANLVGPVTFLNPAIVYVKK